MTPSEADRLEVLLDKADEFAGRINRTLSGVLHGHSPVDSTPLPSGRGALVESLHTNITRDSKPCFILSIQYFCNWSSTSDYLAVMSSKINVRVPDRGVPLVRFDYLRDPDRVPASHINFSSMPKDMSEKIAKPHDPEHPNSDDHNSSRIHLPTGGHRFRPTLEDVLEMLIQDFKIDAKDDWRTAVRAGRQEFRKRQLAAAVGDDPQTAIEQLSKMKDLEVLRLERLGAF